MLQTIDRLTRAWVFYPLLFAVNQILLLAGPNLGNVPLQSTWQPILWLLAAATFSLLLLRRWSRDAHRAGLLTLLGLLWFGYYGLTVQMLNAVPGIEMSLALMLLWLVVWSVPFALAGSPWLWRKVRQPGVITQYFNLLSILLLLFALQRIYSYEAARVPAAEFSEVYPPAPALNAAQRPDIYYIIADGYTRQDVLQEVHGFDNQPFISYLEERGFYVAAQSRSNYYRTVFAMSSTLNFDYLPPLPYPSNDETPLQWLYANNRLQQALHGIGYQSIAMTGWIAEQPHKILAALYWNNSLLALPIKANWVQTAMPRNRDQQALIQGQIERLSEIAAQPGPKFVYLHILTPHPPFIYDSNGPIRADEVYMLSDGATFPGSPQEYIQGYRQQIQYVNRLLEQAVENILQNAPTAPIIIIQGDHGSGAYLSEDLEKSCARERFAILNAYYLPGEAAERLYPDITPVNTFRLVLSSYFGAEIELFADERSYFPAAGQSYNYIDVTERTNQPCP